MFKSTKRQKAALKPSGLRFGISQILAGDAATSGGVEMRGVSSEDADFERRVQEMKTWMSAKPREQVKSVILLWVKTNGISLG